MNEDKSVEETRKRSLRLSYYVLGTDLFENSS